MEIIFECDRCGYRYRPRSERLEIVEIMLSEADVQKIADALGKRDDQVVALEKEVADLQAKVGAGGINNPTLEANVAAAISKDAGVRTHRPPVLRGCHRVFQLCGSGDGIAPYDAAIQVREQSRLIGRPLAKRTVGSTLLLKGLEADVSVILSPDVMDNRHLYVAMTRGARRLVICSNAATINS